MRTERSAARPWNRAEAARPGETASVEPYCLHSTLSSYEVVELSASQFRQLYGRRSRTDRATESPRRPK